MKFMVSRAENAGVAIGGHIISETFGFEAEFPVAGIRLQFGSEVAWLSRDEAHAVAAAIIEAAIDA